jgi:hypothetical protein
MGNPILITTSSANLTSGVAALDWRVENPTSFSLTLSSSQGSATATVQATLDDPMRVTSSAIVWQDVSSAISLSSAGALGSSILVLSGAIAALRSVATAQSSASLQLRVLQA